MADNVYSFVHYEGDGSTRNFSVPFDYLDRDHVVIKVNGESASFTWLDSNTIRLSEAPPSGIVIEVRRETSHESRRVIFHDGSVLTEDDLNDSIIHTFYMAQEAVDLARNTLLLTPTGEISAQGRRLTNLADPVDPQDAATKGYLDLIRQDALKARDDAQTARSGAETARDTAWAWAETAYNSAKQWATSTDIVAGNLKGARGYAQDAQNAMTKILDEGKWFVSEDTISVTIGVGESLIISDPGPGPYDTVTLGII